MRRAPALLAMLLLCSGCISEFDPDLDAPPKRLVVDGLVTSGAGPHTVRLTYSAAFEQSLAGLTETVEGAAVTLEDDAGGRAVLADAGAGFYHTERGALVGRVGRRYTLTVALPDGRVYQAQTAPMPSTPPPIDSAFAELKQQPSSKRFFVQTYAETEDPADVFNYYRWTWSGIYEDVVKFGLINFPCWFEDSPPIRQSSTLSLLDDTFVDGGRITRQPVVRLPFDKHFLFGYMMSITQYALSREAYEFWHQVELQLDQTGTPFDPPPDRIRGNVVNQADATDRALGYFGASSVATTRICISVRNFPDRPPIPSEITRVGPTCASVNGLSAPPDVWTCSPTTGSQGL